MCTSNKVLGDMDTGPELYLENYLFEWMDLAEWMLIWWHKD